MRLFQSESGYYVTQDKWEENYKIDGIPVDGDLYFFELERERDLETKKMVDEFEAEQLEIKNDNYCPCCGCNGCEDKITYDELLDIFVEKIIETGPCRTCLKELLDIFADEVIEFVDGEDEFED